MLQKCSGERVVQGSVKVGLELSIEERNLAKNCDYKGFLARGQHKQRLADRNVHVML